MKYFLLICFLLLQFVISFKKYKYYSYKSARRSTVNNINDDSSDISDKIEDDTQGKIAALLNDNNSQNDKIDIYEDTLDIRNRKLVNVVLSAFLAFGIFSFEHFQPASSVMLLKEMEKESIGLKQALCNGKPTIIDFYADWCENCKSMAPTFRQMEFLYDKNVNFVTIDGSNPANSKLVETFRVDGIPHIAFISDQTEVKTALVGAVPKEVLKSEIEALITNKDLPYLGYDAFEEESHIIIRDKSKFCNL